MRNILSYILIIVFAILSAFQLPDAVALVCKRWQIYIPLFCGVVGNAVLSFIPIFSKNKEHLMVLSHELTHWAVSLLFFRKIHTLNVGENSGYITHSGGKFGDIFISLSPYCFPILTFFLLLFRLIIAKDSLVGFDIFVGLTLGFHIGCFASQMSIHQSDISSHGIPKSYMFIVASWIFFTLVILFSIRYNIMTSLKMICTGYWGTLTAFWDMIV